MSIGKIGKMITIVKETSMIEELKTFWTNIWNHKKYYKKRGELNYTGHL